MIGKDFLSIADLTSDEIWQIVRDAEEIKQGRTEQPLEGKRLALLFEKASLRTRVSFEIGIRELGGQCIYLARDEVGMGVREPVADVARILDRWLDGIIARVYNHDSLETLAANTSIPIINALSDREHPCQAICDMLTIKEHKGILNGLRLAFIGDGNNVAASLAIACGSVGMDFVHASPQAYRISESILDTAKSRAAAHESGINWVMRPKSAAENADIVYTDVWVSMGQEADTEQRLRDFEGYQVDIDLMGHAKPDSMFMHDMPAHEGKEIATGMLENPRSVVFDQAENRLHGQKAILAKLFAD